MKIKPFLLIAGVLVLGLFIYFGLTTTPPASSEKVMAKSHQSGIDLIQLVASAKPQIDKKYLAAINALEEQLKSARNKTQTEALYKQLVLEWDSAGGQIIAAKYAVNAAASSGTAADYAAASNRMIDAMQHAADSVMKKALADEGFEVVKRAIELDSTNVDNKVNLAICLMEGKQDVMQGVQILLPLVKNNPNHLKANFILGKFAVVSGQYAKAVTRLEKVIQIDKHFTSAYIVLSQAYIKMGNSIKAKEVLVTCKRNETDKEAQRELQQMIDQL